MSWRTDRPRVRHGSIKTAYGLLRWVQRLILEEPKRYNQGLWIEDVDSLVGYQHTKAPACGTTACVAGWVGALTFGRKKTIDAAERDWSSGVHHLAQRKLGLTDDQALMLFDGDALNAVGLLGTEAYARAGVAHIQRFIDENAKQLRATKVTVRA